MKLWDFIKMVFSFLFFAIIISVGTLFVGEEISWNTLLITAVYWLLFWFVPKVMDLERVTLIVVIGILALVFIAFNLFVKNLWIDGVFEIYMISFALLFFVYHCRRVTKDEKSKGINEFGRYKILIAYNESYTL